MSNETQNQELRSRKYSAFREKWVHEDNLINHRLNWLIMSQTILFAAYGLLIGIKIEKSDLVFVSKISCVIKVLPAIGIAVSVLVFLGIVGAVGAMYELRKNRTTQVKEMDIDAALWTSILGQGTGLFLPLVFMIGWFYVNCA